MSLIKKANLSYKNKRYAEAKALYQQAKISYPEISSSIDLSIRRCETNITNEEQIIPIERTQPNNNEFFKTFCVGMVRNEIDIISTWIDHTTQIFDEIIIIDHKSTDGTREKIISHAQENKNIRLYIYENEGYRQSELMNYIVWNQLDFEKNDWVFLLDVDEFIEVGSKESLQKILRDQQHSVIEMPWTNLVPTDYGDDKKDINLREFWRPVNPAKTTKIAFQPYQNINAVIQQGNHFLIDGATNEFCAASHLSLGLIHIPIRTRGQFKKKIDLGVKAYDALAEQRRQNEGAHWYQYKEQIEKKKLTNELLNGIILSYGSYSTPARETTEQSMRGLGFKKIYLNNLITREALQKELSKNIEFHANLIQENDVNSKLLFRQRRIILRNISNSNRTAYRLEHCKEKSFDSSLSRFVSAFQFKNYTIPENAGSIETEILISQKNTARLFEKFLSCHVINAESLFIISSLEFVFAPLLIERLFPKSICYFLTDSQKLLGSANAFYDANGLQRTFSHSMSMLPEIVKPIKPKKLITNHSFNDSILRIVLIGDSNINLIKDLTERIEKNSMKLSLYSSRISIEDFLNTSEHFENYCQFDGKYEVRKSVLGNRSDLELGLDIVVAMYNSASYIVECVDSLLKGSPSKVRVIIVNDGSTDNSLAVVKKAYGLNNKVVILSKENGGCASARNYGRSHSNRSHIAFVDADDFTSEGFFYNLFKIALTTGAEVVQGEFDFYDSTKSNAFSDSYERDSFKSVPRLNIEKNTCFKLKNTDLISGQPTIWRRVYRRDYLDSKEVFFPENIRAFDDYIFHVLTLYYARDIYMLEGMSLHYRQHPGQDIKQADERHFNVIFQFRMILRRSVEEGWSDFHVFFKSFFNTVAWSLQSLRQDLLSRYADAAADFFNDVRLVHGESAVDRGLLSKISNRQFQDAWRLLLKKSKNSSSQSYGRAYRIEWTDHQALVKQNAAIPNAWIAKR